MLLPRILRPLPATTARDPIDTEFGPAPIALLRPRRGEYSAQALAGVIEHAGRWHDSAWLRQAQPARWPLADALTEACRHRWPGTGEAPMAPADPTARLIDALRSAPPGAVLVVELDNAPTAQTGALLGELRPVLADRGAVLVVVAERRLPWPGRGADPAACWAAVPDRLRADLPARLPAMTGHRSALIQDLVDATASWPVNTVTEAVERAKSRPELLRALTADLLEMCSPAQRAALQESARLGYWHPRLGTESVPVSRLRPWVYPLEDGWGWLRPVWRRPLQRALAAGASQASPRAGQPARDAGRPPAMPAATAPTLEARLLGPFELRIDGRAVRNWNGPRGVQVMRYLLARRQYACSRDALLEEFWPDVAPDAARNRLQVAISGLRRALAEVTSVQVLEFVDGEYRVNPRLHVKVDVQRFERALSEARRAERAGELDAASARFREAVDLYRGDFVPDAPYGQWTLLPRESLRLAYVDALDRISRIHHGRGEVDQCIAAALRMLDVDPCCEPAHRMLIRCYADQGRTYLALRQFELCQRVLRQTLDAEPQAETTQLYMSVRTGHLRGARPDRLARV